jgi:hypothetical protein
MDENNYYRQMALVLVKMKRFQKAVMKFREAIGIPSTGIPPDERASWYQQLFIKRTVSAADMHRLFRIDVNQQTLPPNRKFLKQLKSFADNFNLDEQWYSSLFSYLVGGDSELLPPDGQPLLDVRVNNALLPADEMEVTSLRINVHKNTTMTEILALKPKIEHYQKMMSIDLPERKKPWDEDNVQNYLKIHELEDQGVRQADIAKQLDLYSAQSVASSKQEIESRFKPKKK